MPKQRNEEVSGRFGRNLATARKRAGLSQEALADKAELSRDAIQKIEHGQRSPRLGSLILLAEALEVELVTLLKGV